MYLFASILLFPGIRSGGKQRIEDNGDTFLTIRLDIGFQSLKVIPDSGSFDLYIVNGDDCSLRLCRSAYRPHFSRTHREPSEDTQVSRDVYFGSGACTVALAFDEVRVHDDFTQGDIVRQVKSREVVPLWEIRAMDDDMISVWGDGVGFQGIVGLGFKGRFGSDEEEIESEKKIVKEIFGEGGDSRKLDKASEILFSDTFAICLPRGENAMPIGGDENLSSRPGRAKQVADRKKLLGMFWWGADYLPKFLWSPVVKVTGSRHWTLSIELASMQGKSGSSVDICETCCAGLVDSGTSLIALSGEKIDKILAETLVGDLKEDCSNIHLMPDLHLEFVSDDDGNEKKEITISPESYIMRVSKQLLVESEISSSGRLHLSKNKVIVVRKPSFEKGRKEDKRNVMKRQFNKNVPLSLEQQDDSSLCTYAFMETPIEKALVQNQENEVIIFGIPLFREYSIKFDRLNETISFAKHEKGQSCEVNNINMHSSSSSSSSLIHQDKSISSSSLSQISNWKDLVFPSSFNN